MIRTEIGTFETSGTKADLIADFAVIVRALYDNGWSKDLLMMITDTCDIDENKAAVIVALATVADKIGNKEDDPMPDDLFGERRH